MPGRWASRLPRPIHPSRALVEQAGLRIISAREETADEDGAPVTFLWVVAEKPPA